MPYELAKRGGQTCVMKKLSDGSLETVKCHPSREQAMAHMRALFVNVEDAKTEDVAVTSELKRGMGLLAYIKRKLRHQNGEDQSGEEKERRLALDKDI